MGERNLRVVLNVDNMQCQSADPAQKKKKGGQEDMATLNPLCSNPSGFDLHEF